MSSSEIPSKEAIRDDLQRRLASVHKQLEQYEALREECRALEAALAALEGKGAAPRSGIESPPPKGVKTRATKEEVQARRARVAEMLAEDPEVSINDVADAVGVSYQSAANDIRLVRESGQPF